MNLYDLTDALIERAHAAGLAARLDYHGGGYEVLWIDGTELIVERTAKGYTLAAYVPGSLETEQLASGAPATLLGRALSALARFRAKLAAKMPAQATA